jgi:hypothetical protein
MLGLPSVVAVGVHHEYLPKAVAILLAVERDFRAIRRPCGSVIKRAVKCEARLIGAIGKSLHKFPSSPRTPGAHLDETESRPLVNAIFDPSVP